jgi:CheY-like chemotaxis protein
MTSLRPKALIIDGDRFTGREVGELLKGAGWETHEVGKYDDPITEAVSEQPNLIILDLNSPGLDGIATFKALREYFRTAEIPIVTLSEQSQSVHDHEELNHTFSLRAPEGMVDKPIDHRCLLTTVMGLVG